MATQVNPLSLIPNSLEERRRALNRARQSAAATLIGESPEALTGDLSILDLIMGAPASTDLAFEQPETVRNAERVAGSLLRRLPGNISAELRATPPERRIGSPDESLLESAQRLAPRALDIAQSAAQVFNPIDPESGLPNIDAPVNLASNIIGITGRRARQLEGAVRRGGNIDELVGGARQIGEEAVGPRGLERAVQRDEFTNTPSVSKALREVRKEQPNLPVSMEVIREEAQRIPQTAVDEVLNASTPPKLSDISPSMRIRLANEQDTVGDQLLQLESRNDLLLPDEARRINQLEDRQRRLARVIDPAKSEAGLRLNIEGQLARQGGFTTEPLLRRAKRLNGGAISDKQVRKLSDLAARGRQTLREQGSEAANKVQEEIGTFMRQLGQTGKLETLSILRRAGMLTGIPTFIRNAVGNLGNIALEEASLVPASLVDSAIVLFGNDKQRTVAGLLGKGTIRQNFQALKDFGHDLTIEGGRRFGEVLRRGATAEELRRFDSPREVRSTLFGGDTAADEFINTYTNFVFRLQVAGDQPARAAAFRRSMTAQARVQALNELRSQGVKRTRENVSQRIDEILAAPSDAMKKEAAAQAEFMVFANDSRLAQALDQARSASGRLGPGGTFLFDAYLPFRRTPSNIAMRVLDFSGVGGTVEIGKAIGRRLAQRGMTPAQQRRLSESIGRGLVGNGLMYLGYKMAEAGLMTGMYSPEPSERSLNEAANRPAGSMLDPITNRWHRVIDFSPTGNLLTMGATHFERDVGANLTGAIQSGAITAETFQDMSFLQSLEDVNRALGVTRDAGDPAVLSERLARLGGQFAGSFVPSFVAGVARQADDRRRDTRGRGSAGQAFVRPIQERIPGARQQLPEALDRFGQPVEQGPAPLADPTFSLPSREDDPLFQAFTESGAKFPSQLRQNKRQGESEEDFTLRRLEKGLDLEISLRELLNTPLFQNQDPRLRELRREALESTVRSVSRQ